MSPMQKLLQQKWSLQARLKKLDAEIQTLESGFVGHEMDMRIPDENVLSRIEGMQGLRRTILSLQSAVNREISLHEARLSRLQYWLRIESIGGISLVVLAKGSFYFSLLAGSFLGNIPFVYYYTVLILAALAFTPFMVNTLIIAEKRNWIVLFVVMVCAPCSLLFIPSQSESLTLALQLFPLLMFYTYCGILWWAVDAWLE